MPQLVPRALQPWLLLDLSRQSPPIDVAMALVIVLAIGIAVAVLTVLVS